MFDIVLLGTSGKQPLDNRALTSMICRVNGRNVLVDAGEGTQMEIRKSGYSFKNIDVICLTHYHSDHIAGLPGILISMQDSNRTKPVTIIGPKGLNHIMNAIRVIARVVNFKINLIELKEHTFKKKCGDFYIEAFKVDHGVLCYGYSISIKRQGKFDTLKALMNGVPESLYTSIQESDEPVYHNGRFYSKDDILGPERIGLKIVYCTDTRPNDLLKEYCKCADLAILEGMYADDSFRNQAIEHKHMLYSEAAKIAKEANVKELWLTHFSPTNYNPKNGAENATNIFKNTKIGFDGMCKTLVYNNNV